MKRGAFGLHECPDCRRREHALDDLAFVIGGLVLLIAILAGCLLAAVV